MDASIKEFINSSRLVIVGVSHDQRKFSNGAYRELKARGYKVFAVNPTLAEIDGEKCYGDLPSLRGEVDGGVICVSPEKVAPILHEAAESGLRNIWLQQGAESKESIKLGKMLGLNLIAGKCILMYAKPVRGFHKVHRFFVRLGGRL